MLSETVIDQTISRFPSVPRAEIKVQALQKGGSDRSYYRIQMSGNDSLILVKYGDQKEENRHYVSIARFLDGEGIRVPRIYFHDEGEGLIWMEDLGEIDLWEHREQAWPQRGALYRAALDQAILLHTRGHVSVAKESLKLEREFNAELYRWEQNYFFENCLERFFHMAASLVNEHRDSRELQDVAEELSLLPRVLVHRDFQSQNIMIKDGAAFLIDFQGLRPGLGQYDVASLLYDPYVVLTESQRDELLDYYLRHSFAAGLCTPGDVHRIFNLCAMQRLMQALGAYGLLGLLRDRPHFLQYIPAALDSLKQVVARISGLNRLRNLLENLP